MRSSTIPARVLAWSVVWFSLLGACSRGDDRPPGTDGGRDGSSGTCIDGQLGCSGREVTQCASGVFTPAGMTCTTDEVCVAGFGCRSCSPGGTFCRDNAVHLCSEDGASSTEVMACGGAEVCSSGTCIDACADARENLSNLGCEYFAVDLDNEYSDSGSNAAAAQFAVTIANPGPVDVTVLVGQNDAPVGSPAPSESLVGSYRVRAFGLERIDLPTRDTDCATTDVPAGVGTCLSPNAYKITTNYPVVAYQFNPIIQQFSNDASLLIPVSGIDTHYRVIGWPTSNPIAVPGLPVPAGIPDHSYVTVVGTEAATTVTVTRRAHRRQCRPGHRRPRRWRCRDRDPRRV